MQASLAWPPLAEKVMIVGRCSNNPIQLNSNGGKLVYGTAIA